jgi:hypothetical protein
MGAAVTELHYDHVVATLKYGLRVADVVVIESGNDNPLRGDGVIRAVNLANAIHTLPNYVAMQNGTRWNGIPIAVLVDDMYTANAIAADPTLQFVVPCSTERLSFTYYEYVDPWVTIYRQIDQAALVNAMNRLEQMQTLGHRFEVEHGRWLRLVPPSLRRQHGGRPEIETQLYDGSADRLLRRSRETDKDWNGRDVVLIEHAAAQHDLDRYEYLVNHAHAESEMQRFYEQRPYMLGAGAFEISAHPAFRPAGAVRPSYPDLVRHSFNNAIVPKPARIIELKTPRSRLITKTGSDWHWARAVTAGLAQTRRYAAHAKQRQYKQQMEAILGESPKRVEKLLIAGRAAHYERERLELARKYDRDVDVRGYDEMLDAAIDRYAS